MLFRTTTWRLHIMSYMALLQATCVQMRTGFCSLARQPTATGSHPFHRPQTESPLEMFGAPRSQSRSLCQDQGGRPAEKYGTQAQTPRDKTVDMTNPPAQWLQKVENEEPIYGKVPWSPRSKRPGPRPRERKSTALAWKLTSTRQSGFACSGGNNHELVLVWALVVWDA